MYQVGSYVMKQRPGGEYTLAEQDHVLEVLRLLGMTDPKAFGEHTFVTYFDSLDRDGKIREACSRLLEFHDPTPAHKLWRILRMKILGETRDAVIEKLKRRVAAQVVADFFVLNFSSNGQSGRSQKQTA